MALAAVCNDTMTGGGLQTTGLADWAGRAGWAAFCPLQLSRQLGSAPDTGLSSAQRALVLVCSVLSPGSSHPPYIIAVSELRSVRRERGESLGGGIITINCACQPTLPQDEIFA